MLELTEIKKHYKEKVIFSDLNLRLDPGEIVLLRGKSGIGKTTLLDMIAGIRLFDSGHYFYQGKEYFPVDDIAMSRFRNQTIGYMVQDFALLDDSTVIENLLLPVRYSKKKIDESIKEEIQQLAVEFGISEILGKKVRHISGGQKQRVAIIRSILLDPAIILADEPTSNLDSENFQLVMNLFENLKRKGKIILVATHDERLFPLADREYHIDNGKLVSIKK